MGMKKKEYIRQIDLIRAIKLHEPVTGPQLAKMFKRTRQAIHMRLRMMERKGLIEKVVPEPDAPIVPVRYRCSGRLRELEQRIQREQSESD
jgi:DNA-binding MarR family transcriptional regulator